MKSWGFFWASALCNFAFHDLNDEWESRPPLHLRLLHDLCWPLISFWNVDHKLAVKWGIRDCKKEEGMRKWCHTQKDMREKLIQTPKPQRDTVFKWSQLKLFRCPDYTGWSGESRTPPSPLPRLPQALDKMSGKDVASFFVHFKFFGMCTKKRRKIDIQYEKETFINIST